MVAVNTEIRNFEYQGCIPVNLELLLTANMAFRCLSFYSA